MLDLDELSAVIDRGAAMRAALQNTALLEAIDHLTTYHLSAMVACRPGYAADAEALNHHHALHHAITEVLAQMAQWSEAGEAASRALEWQRNNGDTD